MKYCLCRSSIVCFVCVVHLLPRVGKEVHLFIAKKELIKMRNK